MPDRVMLFAAGFGTRMGALTKTRPKPLIEVAGTPLIDHAVGLVQEFGAQKIVVNAHYHADQIVSHFTGSDIHVTVEAPDILDTGGGLKAALPLLDAREVFTMNTDAVWKGPNPLSVLQNAWQAEMDALLLCIPAQNAVGRGAGGDIDIGPDGTARWGTDHVYSGLQIIRTDRVATWPDKRFSLKVIWQALETEGKLRAVSYPGQWCDVGHPEGIGLAEALLDARDV